MSPAAKPTETSGTVSVTWTSPGDRVISKADFGTVNLEHDGVEWSAKNKHTALVSSAVAEYLLTEETGFQLTEKVRKAKLEELDIKPEDLAGGEADAKGNVP